LTKGVNVLLGLGEVFTPRVKLAWTWVYGLMASTMINAAEKASQNISPILSDKEFHVVPTYSKHIRARLAAVDDICAGVKEFHFESEAPVKILPGQYCKIHVKLSDEKVIARHFTVTNTTANRITKRISMMIKTSETGLVSKHMHKLMKLEDEIQISGISGSFTFPTASTKKKLLLLSAGIGITPILSNLRDFHVRSEKPHLDMVLVHSNRGMEIPCFQELSSMEKSLIGNSKEISLKNFWTVTGNASSSTHRLGRVTEQYMKDILAEKGWQNISDENTQAFLCGPPEFISLMKKSLVAQGMKDSSITVEWFDL
jgi:ferredoxin-NADP reductase